MLSNDSHCVCFVPSAATQIVNDGAFIDDSSGGGAFVLGAFTNRGTITVKATDTLAILGTNTLGGTINGPGTLIIGAGETKLTTADVTVGAISIYTGNNGSGELTLETSLTYGGALSMLARGQSILNLNGQTLTLTGTSNALMNVIRGPGTLLVTGAATIAAYLYAQSDGQAATIIDAGTMTQSGLLTLQGTLRVTAGATYALNAQAIVDSGATVVNEGTFAVSPGNSLDGSSSIGGTFVNTGTLTVDSGARLLATGLDVLSGTVTGSGTVIASGTSMLGALTIGGSLLFRNTGTVNQSGTVTLGDASGGPARVTNAAGASWIIAGDGGVTAGNAAATFNNRGGTLTKASGTGTSTIGVNLANLGGVAATVSVASGTLRFTGAANTFLADTITGAGTIAIRGGGTSTIGAGTTIATAGWVIGKAATRVVLETDVTFAGAFAQKNLTMLDLGSSTLRLTGAVTFDIGPSGAPIVTGAGKLITSGVDTIGGLTIGGSTLLRVNGIAVQTGGVTLGEPAAGPRRSRSARPASGSSRAMSASRRGSSRSVINLGGGSLTKIAGTSRSIVTPDIENLSSTVGVIRAKVGKLELGGTLSGALDLRVNPGATLLLDKAASPGTTATFAGTGGTLRLNDAADFHGTIAGFAGGDKLDLRSILSGADSGPALTYSGTGSSGTLTVSDGRTTATLAMTGRYDQVDFHLANDGHGGTLVTVG